MTWYCNVIAFLAHLFIMTMICGHVKLPFISVHIDDDEQKPVGHRGYNMDLYHLRTPEKNRELARLQPRSKVQAAPKHSYLVSSDSVDSNRQMYLNAFQRQPGHCQAQYQAKIRSEKRRRSTRCEQTCPLGLRDPAGGLPLALPSQIPSWRGHFPPFSKAYTSRGVHIPASLHSSGPGQRSIA